MQISIVFCSTRHAQLDFAKKVSTRSVQIAQATWPGPPIRIIRPVLTMIFFFRFSSSDLMYVALLPAWRFVLFWAIRPLKKKTEASRGKSFFGKKLKVFSAFSFFPIGCLRWSSATWKYLCRWDGTVHHCHLPPLSIDANDLRFHDTSVFPIFFSSNVSSSIAGTVCCFWKAQRCPLSSATSSFFSLSHSSKLMQAIVAPSPF